MIDLRLDPASPVPLYHQLGDTIRRAIRDGGLVPGTRLPSEMEIAGQVGISRPTVRQAIHQLTQEGLLVRRRGLGTFVREQKAVHRLDEIGSFSEAMKRLGLKPGARLLARRVIPAPRAVAEMLSIPAGTPVVTLRRLRTADGEPILLNTAYLPADLVPHLLARDLTGSLYRLLESRYHLQLRWATETFEPVSLRREDAVRLKVPPGSPGLLVERVTYAQAERPVELSQSLIRGDRCKFYTRLERRPAAVSSAGAPRSPEPVVAAARR